MPLPPRLAHIAATQRGLFTASQALGAGYGEREIKVLTRTTEWLRLRRGIYIESRLVPTDDSGRHVLGARAALLRVKDWRSRVISRLLSSTKSTHSTLTSRLST